jgi:hypothetical protein
MDEIEEKPMSARPPAPQAVVVAGIKRAIAIGYRRLLVLGQPRSRRLSSVRLALEPLGIRVAVVDLAAVRSRKDLDFAVRRATRGADFYGGMRILLREAQRRPLAIVFHNLDSCSASAEEDYVLYRVWSEAKNHCGSALVFFTATNPDFVAKCYERFEPCRAFVRQFNLSRRDHGNAPSADIVGRR